MHFNGQQPCSIELEYVTSCCPFLWTEIYDLNVVDQWATTLAYRAGVCVKLLPLFLDRDQ